VDGIQNQGEQGVDCGGPCPPCQSGSCADVNLGSQVPWTVTGDTTGEGDDFQPTACGLAGGAPDVSYAFTAPAAADYQFSLQGSSYDTVLYLLGGSCSGQEIDCNDDYLNSQSYITRTLTAGETVIIVVDGYDSEGGSFTLDVSVAGASCTDGIQNQGEQGIDCGGPCSGLCPTCTDGIQNQGEQGIDCGGPCSGLCPTCTDGIQNQGELGIDCEGPCSGLCPTCSDGIQNGGELDVDCGGSCPLCAPGTNCTSGAGCDSGVCGNGLCLAPNCLDGVKNQGELDADCGGPCALCAVGTACTSGAGCASGVCGNGQCQAPTCLDGVKNAGEIDADCGGSCLLCAAGAACTSGAACSSGVCSNGQCQASTCQDGVQNGSEIDADCGGACGTCPDGKACITGVDCSSNVCQLNACRPASCADGAKDGSESDVDCGGLCGGCAAGHACSIAADCAGGRCVSGMCGPPPVPTPTDPTVATDMASSIEFLYQGANAVQTGVAPGAIEARRVAVARGRVLDRNGDPIPDVAVSQLGHPELGVSYTRADGAFDLAINGGGTATLVYAKPGLLPAQRQVAAPWLDFVTATDVVMIALDSEVTNVDLQNTTTTQVARGSVSSDADGSRQATVMFEPGTAAEMVLPDGTRRGLTALSVRATEYTVGVNGPHTMPAELPPASGYTYAVEMSVDQAFLAKATEVRFSKPVAIYVDNFLAFPTGEIVPVGVYAKGQGAWLASENGRIVEILSVTAGLADLDVDGSGVVADPTALAALGITDGERAQLATLYAPGASLWRVPVSHFSLFDFNWPYGPPPDAEPPPPPPPLLPPSDCPSGAHGSIIECESQVLGEEIPVAGTPFLLQYSTQGKEGLTANRALDIKASGATVPSSLKRIEVIITMAGMTQTVTLPATPNQTHHYVWDGLDGYGRPAHGMVSPTVTLRYVYPATYYAASADYVRSFAQFPKVSFEQSRVLYGEQVYGGDALGGRNYAGGTSDEIYSDTPYLTGAVRADDPSLDMGGWKLSPRRGFQQGQRGELSVLNTPHRIPRISSVIEAVAGSDQGVPDLAYEGPATSAGLSSPRGVAVSPDGSVVFADSNRVRRITPDGIIHTLAGCSGDTCDGRIVDEVCEECGGGIYSHFVPRTAASCGPTAETPCIASRTSLFNPVDVATGPDGSLYVADQSGGVYRIGTDGSLVTIAGTTLGQYASGTPSGDGGPALDAQITPVSIAVGRDGAVFVADKSGNRVRRIGPEGFISTVAGNGADGFSGDGGLAVNAPIGEPLGVAVGPDGTLYIATRVAASGQIRSVSVDGIILTIAGNGQYAGGQHGDLSGLAAKSIGILPQHVAVARDGSVYFDDLARVYRLQPDGLVMRVLGGDPHADLGDGGFAVDASISEARGLAFGPDGRLVLSTPSRVRSVGPFGTKLQLAPPSWSFVGDVTLYPEGDVVHVFDAKGRHLKTVDRLTGSTIYDFGYDSSGRLVSVTGAQQELTAIQRAPSGAPTMIVAPGGEATALAVGADGYLASVTSPSGASAHMTYAPGGILATYTDPRGGLHQFTYDEAGNLVRDDNAIGGYTTLARVDVPNGYEVTTTTALGRVKHYRLEDLPDGTRVHTVIDERGGVVASATAVNGTTTTTYADGSQSVTTFAPDPVWGLLDPYESTQTLTPPGGTPTTTLKTITAVKTQLNAINGVTRVETTSRAGKTWTQTYDGVASTLTRVSPAQGKRSVETYDLAGRMVSLALVDVLTGQSQVTTRTFDALGLLSSTTGPAGAFTFTYDAGARVQTKSDALGHTTTYAYNVDGRLATVTDPNGVSTAVAYDAEGNILSRTTGGATTTYTYDGEGSLVSTVLPDGSWENLVYDLDGRAVEKTDSSGGRLALVLDDVGNLSQEDIYDTGATRRFTAQHTYDGLRRKTQTTNGAGLTTSYTYAWQQLAGVTDGLGNQTQFFFDSLDALQETRDPLQHSTYYAHDDATNLQTVTDARGAITSYQFDGLDRRLSTTSPNTGATVFTYDSMGNVATSTDARGVTTTHTRDAAGRILTTAYSTGAPSVSYAYDAGAFGKGRLTGITEGVGTVNTTHDALGSVVEEQRTVGGVLWTTTYTYDAAGRVATLALAPGGATLTFARDAIGRVSGITASDGVSSRVIVSGASYLPFGPLRHLMLGNGVPVDHQLDLDYRPAHFTAGAVLDRSYAYDAAGDLVAITDAVNPGESQAFGYDAARRLTAATGAYGTETYAYDAVGNRTSVTRNGAINTYSYGAASQRLLGITGSTAEAFAYDPAGNATTVGGISLTYDENNRVVAAHSGGQLLATYERSALGQRVRKTDGAGNVTVYLYDGTRLLATADGAGNLIEQHVYLDGMRVAVLHGGHLADADVTYVVDDHRGAPAAILDQAGQVVWSASYRPFGEATVSTSAVTNDLRLPGQIYDAETGLYDNVFRTYDPRVGRYLQSDPLGLDGGINTYTYVDNSPVLWTDPLGLFRISGSAYAGPGGGGSLAFDSHGVTVCAEVGLGEGFDVEVAPMAHPEPSKAAVEATVVAHRGPASVEIRVGVETAGLCGIHAAAKARVGLGKTGAEAEVSVPITGPGKIESHYGPVINNLGHGVEGKVAARVCKHWGK
jgi:RHS repeat-associated protein